MMSRFCRAAEAIRLINHVCSESEVSSFAGWPVRWPGLMASSSSLASLSPGGSESESEGPSKSPLSLYNAGFYLSDVLRAKVLDHQAVAKQDVLLPHGLMDQQSYTPHSNDDNHGIGVPAEKTEVTWFDPKPVNNQSLFQNDDLKKHHEIIALRTDNEAASVLISSLRRRVQILIAEKSLLTRQRDEAMKTCGTQDEQIRDLQRNLDLSTYDNEKKCVQIEGLQKELRIMQNAEIDSELYRTAKALKVNYQEQIANMERMMSVVKEEDSVSIFRAKKRIHAGQNDLMREITVLNESNHELRGKLDECQTRAESLCKTFVREAGKSTDLTRTLKDTNSKLEAVGIKSDVSVAALNAEREARVHESAIAVAELRAAVKEQERLQLRWDSCVARVSSEYMAVRGELEQCMARLLTAHKRALELERDVQRLEGERDAAMIELSSAREILARRSPTDKRVPRARQATNEVDSECERGTGFGASEERSDDEWEDTTTNLYLRNSTEQAQKAARKAQEQEQRRTRELLGIISAIWQHRATAINVDSSHKDPSFCLLTTRPTTVEQRLATDCVPERQKATVSHDDDERGSSERNGLDRLLLEKLYSIRELWPKSLISRNYLSDLNY